jgi:hypothetical protein
MPCQEDLVSIGDEDPNAEDVQAAGSQVSSDEEVDHLGSSLPKLEIT